MARKKSVIILGASRGLGLALAEEYCVVDYEVVATVRTPSPALEQLHERFPSSLQIKSADTTDPDSIARLKDEFQESEFDTLFVNAGICIAKDNTPIDVAESDFVALMLTNALSPMRVIEALQALVVADGTIAVMSSGQGSVTNNTRGGFEIYRASKSALNQLMRSFAARHADDPRTLLLMAPGWVQTGLGGPRAPLTVDQSIPGVVNTIEAQAGKGGLQYLDYQGRTVSW